MGRCVEHVSNTAVRSCADGFITGCCFSSNKPSRRFQLLKKKKRRPKGVNSLSDFSSFAFAPRTQCTHCPLTLSRRPCTHNPFSKFHQLMYLKRQRDSVPRETPSSGTDSALSAGGRDAGGKHCASCLQHRLLLQSRTVRPVGWFGCLGIISARQWCGIAAVSLCHVRVVVFVINPGE